MLLSATALGAIVVFLFLWILGLSFWLYRTNKHYSRLVARTGKEDLRAILESLLQNQTAVEKHLKDLHVQIRDFEKKSQEFIQRIGLIKFNPYNETGGDQSFALALLDEKDTGIVILSLHGREGTRIYIKSVNQGKATLELSKEEKQAIDRARIVK